GAGERHDAEEDVAGLVPNDSEGDLAPLRMPRQRPVREREPLFTFVDVDHTARRRDPHPTDTHQQDDRVLLADPRALWKDLRAGPDLRLPGAERGDRALEGAVSATEPSLVAVVLVAVREAR